MTTANPPKKRAQAIEYDQHANVLRTQEFEWAEDAIAWCNARRNDLPRQGECLPAVLVELDTMIGYQLMTEPERENMEHGVWPDHWYEVHGFDEDTQQMRELYAEDHRDSEENK